MDVFETESKDGEFSYHSWLGSQWNFQQLLTWGPFIFYGVGGLVGFDGSAPVKYNVSSSTLDFFTWPLLVVLNI